MLLLLFDLPGGVECFKEEGGIEERRGFCLVVWFVEKKKKKKLSVVGGCVVIRGSKQA